LKGSPRKLGGKIRRQRGVRVGMMIIARVGMTLRESGELSLILANEGGREAMESIEVNGGSMMRYYGLRTEHHEWACLRKRVRPHDKGQR